MSLTPDTGARETTDELQGDHQHIGTGSEYSLGGKSAPSDTEAAMSHGADTYPGPRPVGENDKSTQPVSGDVDPSSTQSSEVTGQDRGGSTANKASGNPWNG